MARPSKRFNEFMEVMKGDDSTPVALTSTSTAVPGEHGWAMAGEPKKRKEKRKNGKEKAEDSADTQAVQGTEREDDDDAAWLKRRQAGLNGEGVFSADDQPSVRFSLNPFAPSC